VRAKALLLAMVMGVVLAASSAASARPKPPDADPPVCRSLAEGTANVDAGWGRPTSSNSCFFFSGPYDLGRDDHLGNAAQYQRQGDQVTVRFGNLVFTGQARGDRVRLRRVSDHSYGSTWTVTEVIDARFVQSNGCTVLRGTYRYNECDTSRPQSCPGTCTISAPVTFTAR
jgi:hypothetical protein